MMSDQEMWQWIHYGYGEDLGLTSDDNDYIALSAEDKVQFQKQLQMEEKMAEQWMDSSVVAEHCLDTSVVSETAASKVHVCLTRL